jgi:hypothetical protein
MFDFADDLVQPGGCHRCQDIGGTILAMQGNAGSEDDRLYANQSRINAMAAGAAWTYTRDIRRAMTRRRFPAEK